jgi:hypothetical protein
MSFEILIERAPIAIHFEREIVKALDAIIERARPGMILGSSQYVFGHMIIAGSIGIYAVIET